MKISKYLEWEPNSDNLIEIKDGCFDMSLTKKEVEIECSWDYGYGGRGTERMYISIDLLEDLIKELKNS